MKNINTLLEKLRSSAKTKIAPVVPSFVCNSCLEVATRTGFSETFVCTSDNSSVVANVASMHSFLKKKFGEQFADKYVSDYINKAQKLTKTGASISLVKVAKGDELTRMLSANKFLFPMICDTKQKEKVYPIIIETPRDKESKVVYFPTFNESGLLKTKYSGGQIDVSLKAISMAEFDKRMLVIDDAIDKVQDDEERQSLKKCMYQLGLLLISLSERVNDVRPYKNQTSSDSRVTSYNDYVNGIYSLLGDLFEVTIELPKYRVMPEKIDILDAPDKTDAKLMNEYAECFKLNLEKPVIVTVNGTFSVGTENGKMVLNIKGVESIENQTEKE